MKTKDRPQRLVSEILQGLGWLLLGAYVYFGYHLIVLTRAWEDGLVGLIAASLAVLGLIALVPPEKRRTVLAFSFLVLFADRSLAAVALSSGLLWALQAAAVLAVGTLVGRLVGRLNRTALLAFLLAALLSTSLSRSDVKLLAHFMPPVKTPPLYGGGTIDYFPLFVDPNRPDRVVTFGNREEVPGEPESRGTQPNVGAGRETLVETARLKREPLFVYAFDLSGGAFRRVPLPDAENAAWIDRLRRDYPGFPFFTIDEDGTLVPIVARDDWAEMMFDFGRVPGALLRLDAAQLRRTAFDVKATLEGGRFQDLVLDGKALRGTYRGTAFRIPTAATEIAGHLTIDGHDALVLLGTDLELATFAEDGTARITHRLDAETIPDIFAAEVLIAPLPPYGDALLLSFPTDSPETAKIILPRADGGWEILYSAQDPLFRFEDVRVQSGETRFLALAPGRLSGYAQRFIGEYVFDRGRLVQRWMAPTSLINVRYVSDGQGNVRIVGTEYGAHRLVLLLPHGIPVVPLYTTLTLILAAGLIGGRLRAQGPARAQARHARRQAVYWAPVVLVAGVLLAYGTTWYGRVAPSADGTAESARIEGDRIVQTEPSAPSASPAAPSSERASTSAPETRVDARSEWTTALARNLDPEQSARFEVTGYTRNAIHKRKTTSMLSGAVILPDRAFGAMRLAGTPYRYYRYGEARYVWTGQTEWVPLGAPAAPLSPFRALEKLTPYFAAAERLPDDTVLGVPARVYRVHVPAAALLGDDPPNVALPNVARQNAERPDENVGALGDLTVDVTVWLTDDPLRLAQIEARWLLPVPGAGATRQEVFFRFYHFNDPGIFIRPPEDIERYVQQP
ncbi:MAG: hypothetical protein IMW86_00710 [Hydrogenibacillus sp.]|nr:hypothetical protein [Hydrogenibacillus sp.]